MTRLENCPNDGLNKVLDKIESNTAAPGGVLYAIRLKNLESKGDVRGVSETELSLEISQDIINRVMGTIRTYQESPEFRRMSSYDQAQVMLSLGPKFVQNEFKKYGMKTITSTNYSGQVPNYLNKESINLTL